MLGIASKTEMGRLYTAVSRIYRTLHYYFLMFFTFGNVCVLYKTEESKCCINEMRMILYTVVIQAHKLSHRVSKKCAMMNCRFQLQNTQIGLESAKRSWKLVGSFDS